MRSAIYVVDDHPVVRRGFRSLVDRQSDMEICGEASSANEALEEMPNAGADLVLVDVAMEGMSGIELIKHLRQREIDVPILVVSMHDEALYADRALQAGARGFVMKDESDEVMLEAMRTVLDGQVFLSPEMNTRALLGRLGGDEESELGTLTDRELEVFQEMGKGRPTQEIAEHLSISPRTVGTYYRNIRDKLEVESTDRLKVKAVLWYHGHDGG